MKIMIQELVEYRHLLLILTWRDIKIRYKQSLMGFLWAIFMPMLIVAAGIIVKKGISIFSGQPMRFDDIASVSVKALPWSFFIGTIRFSTNSLVANRALVTKIYFPREVFPLASVLASLFDFTIASIALIAILGFMGIGISFQILWIPPLLLFLVLFSAGLGLLLSCANLFFRDVKYIVDVILTFAIFITPVFYEASMFGNWETLILMNPVGAILECVNTVVVLHRPPNYFWMSYAASWGIGLFLFSWNVFHHLEYSFAENI
jgi:ABC-type polysaccharide/polyol phosphate export permease